MIVIGEDEQCRLAHVDIVLDARLTRLDQQRVGQRVGGWQQPDFGGLVVTGRDDNPFAVGGEARRSGEAELLLVVDLGILPRIGADAMHEDAINPPVLVGAAIDEHAIACRPDQC